MMSLLCIQEFLLSSTRLMNAKAELNSCQRSSISKLRVERTSLRRQDLSPRLLKSLKDTSHGKSLPAMKMYADIWTIICRHDEHFSGRIRNCKMKLRPKLLKL